MWTKAVGRRLSPRLSLVQRANTSIRRVQHDAARETNPLYPYDQFDVRDKVVVTTGGGRGIGFEMSSQLAEAGAHVYAFDKLEKPEVEFTSAQKRKMPYGGSLNYRRCDVTSAKTVDEDIAAIAEKHGKLNGLIAAAGINRVDTAIHYPRSTVEELVNTNFVGAFTCATAAGRQMLERKCRGSIIVVASMSGLIANKGMYSSAYNCSKAADVQLARNLAQEWGPINEDGSGGIRVNSLCPGHTYTPMVEKTIQDSPGARETWEAENMLGRIARPWEFRGSALFLMSDASSFMTGSTVVVDGGHTAW